MKCYAPNAILMIACTLACGGDAPRGDEDSPRGEAAPAGSATFADAPAPHASLAGFLPQSFADYPRLSVEENTQNFMDATSHSVGADYGPAEMAGFPPVSITLWDHGDSAYMIRTFGILGAATEEQTDDGFVRHTTFAGHPNSESRTGSDVEMEIWVGGRYLVEIQSRGMTVPELREAAGALDLEGLATLSGEG